MSDNYDLQSSKNTPNNAHEIDYAIFGSEIQYVDVVLDPGESVIAEPEAMMYYDDGIVMQAQMGDASNKGFVGNLFNATKRAISGEKMFMVMFTNKDTTYRKTISFAAPYPGKIISLDMADLGGEILCQKGSFICAARGVSVDFGLQFNLGKALFGGMGFVMQKIKGDGLAFLNSGGIVAERELAEGEVCYVDSGSLLAIQPSVTLEVKFINGIRNMFFAGEGLFISRITGPGKVWIQSLPFSRLRCSILGELMPKK